MKNNIATLIVIIMMAVFTLPVMAQPQTFNGATAPQTTFQSTNTMMGSGSAYSSKPMLNSNGIATYEGASYTPAQAPNGPKKIGGYTPSGSPMPIGDAVLPLMLCALAYLIVRATRKRTLNR